MINRPPPKDRRRSLGIVLLKGPWKGDTGQRTLHPEPILENLRPLTPNLKPQASTWEDVTDSGPWFLHAETTYRFPVKSPDFCRCVLQGYFAHKKPPYRGTSLIRNFPTWVPRSQETAPPPRPFRGTLLIKKRLWETSSRLPVKSPDFIRCSIHNDFCPGHLSRLHNF